VRRLKRLAQRVLPYRWYAALVRLRARFIDEWATASFSQEGEDVILSRAFEGVEGGFYVDVGAHHPRRFSNTYLFYKRGWSGVNIDAMPGSMTLFRRERPRDVNLEVAIAAQQKEMTFFIFNETALNSFDEELARSRERGKHRIVRRQKVVARPLREVLAKNLPPGQAIHFLSVDVEGFDLEVLESNDWSVFRPEYVLTECFGMNVKEVEQSPIYSFLSAQGYTFWAKTANTAIFQRTGPARA
jgi:FkbM family methyltransferase